MTKAEALTFQAEFEAELHENIVPFWEKFSLDAEYGGYINCLDRDGTIFDTDKFMWMQGREIWCFSHLYRTIAPRPGWLESARLGADFIRKFGRSENGDYYFSLDRAGKPLVQPYNIFSDCFCAAGLAEYGRVSGEAWAAEEALRLWRRIQDRKSNPKGMWTKQIGENRPQRAMAISMTQLWLSEVYEGLVPEAELEPLVAESARDILTLHMDLERHAVFERVFADGSQPQGMDGRLLSPGHALETLFLLLNAVSRLGVRGESEATRFLPEGWTMARVCEAMLWTIERGWDEEHGGIYYYRDYENRPLDKLESDMKLWWVHVEAMSAFLLAHRITGKPEYEAWFRRIKDWTWGHFRDPEYGEWYGYLDRRGEPALSLKGGKWKGMFHIPRALMYCADIFGQLEKEKI
ncbi:MAG: AGE family epimerase/isomerase [Spirochaetes bacterium]|nr:AGE family epimerase/isomerase [Spirochaetota bacterium]